MSFRFNVNLLETDRGAGGPEADDIVSLLEKSKREPVMFPVPDDGRERVRHLLELRLGDRPEPMAVEMNIPRRHIALLIAIVPIIIASIVSAGKEGWNENR